MVIIVTADFFKIKLNNINYFNLKVKGTKFTVFFKKVFFYKNIYFFVDKFNDIAVFKK